MQHCIFGKGRCGKLKHLYFLFVFVHVETLATPCTNAKWSKTHRCWHIANNRTHLTELFRVFKGKAYLNTEALFVDKTKQKTSISSSETSKIIAVPNPEYVKKINEF